MVAPLAAAAGKGALNAAANLLDDANARIKNFPAVMILGVALLFDAAQFMATMLMVLPILGLPLAFALSMVITVSGYAILYTVVGILFRVTPLGDDGNFMALGLTALEFIPGVSGFLPGTTASMAALIVGSRLKDNAGDKAKNLSSLVVRQRREMVRMQQQHKQSERQAYAQSRKRGQVVEMENRGERKKKEDENKKTQIAAIGRYVLNSSKKTRPGQEPSPYSRSTRPGAQQVPANDNYPSEFLDEELRGYGIDREAA